MLSLNSAPTKVGSEIRYFLSSCPDSPAVSWAKLSARTGRRPSRFRRQSRWNKAGGVENALHWVLDVTFGEDDSRVRDRTAARNLALLRKVALNIVGRDRTTRASVRGATKESRLERCLHAQAPGQLAGDPHAKPGPNFMRYP